MKCSDLPIWPAPSTSPVPSSDTCGADLRTYPMHQISRNYFKMRRCGSNRQLKPIPLRGQA